MSKRIHESFIAIDFSFFYNYDNKEGVILADSNITKRALAAALKELMETVPFPKISIADICEKCEMNRKSFYYHFKDKYDLVNWIYDTEFISFASRKAYVTGWDFLSDLCNYLYDNKDFYRKALKISGQNSFSDHFEEMLRPVISARLKEILEEEALEFQVNFFSDAFLCTIERWLLEKEPMAAKDFLEMLRLCIYRTAAKVYEEFNETLTDFKT